MSEVVLFGEPMVMFVAQSEGKLEDVEMFRRLLAGAEVNVAIGLKRLGHSVSYITRLGNDPFGRYIEKKLKQEGLKADVSYDDVNWTGFQLKSRVRCGDPEVVYFRRNSAAAHLRPEDIDGADLTGAKLLHITGIPAALSKSCRAALFHLIERARALNMSVTFDPNLRPSLWQSREEMVEVTNDIASKADVVLPGTAEGKILMGSDNPEKIADFYLSHGAKAVVVKAGSRGAYAAGENGGAYCPGFRVEHVVDTVGAGDGFAVGVISGYLEGLNLREAARRGNAIGAMQVQVESDNEGLPTREELTAFEEREYA